MNVNDGTSCNLHHNDVSLSLVRDTDIKKEIYIKTEYKVTDDYEVKPGIVPTAEWDNGIKDEITNDLYHNNTNIEEIYIKSEPVDTSEFENELYSAAVTTTEDRDTLKIYGTSSAKYVFPYNYNTNIITEETDIKPECGYDAKYEESAAGQDKAANCVSVVANKFEKNITIQTIEACYKDDVCAQAEDRIAHKPVHIDEKTFKCDQCNKAFSHRGSLVKHKRVHTGEKPFKCDQCDKAFSQSTHLINHKRIHSGERTYKCEQCNKAFSRKGSLINHMRVHSGEKPFVCDQCNKAFSESSHLIRHKRIHTGEKPFKCLQCDKSFSVSSHLSRHKQIHSGEKAFKCEQCNKAFNRQGTLVTHKRIHSGEKPFKCDQCDKAFSESSPLIRHKRIHSGERPFKCVQCDRAFSVSSHLTRHKRIHSGKKTYKCD